MSAGRFPLILAPGVAFTGMDLDPERLWAQRAGWIVVDRLDGVIALMSNAGPRQRVDYVTMAGWGLLLMPLLTMWHEIGGHAAVCASLGGRVTTIGAFYVECDGLHGLGNILVACAGVFVNVVLSVMAHLVWRRAAGAMARVALWLIWVSEAFVASGYFLFSGVTGYGDLGIGEGGALSGFGLGWPFRIVEIAVGVGSYIWLVRTAIGALNTMVGQGPETRHVRRVIAHVYYASAGLGAVLVGLLNPLGIVITVMSAAASSFGGLAGFISIGYAVGDDGEGKSIVIGRNYWVLGAGVMILSAFAVILGPSVHVAQ